MIHLLPSSIAFISTLIFLYIFYNFAISIQLVDRPDYRKKHKGEIPLIGGIAILFGFFLACLLSPRDLSEWRPLFFCLIPLVVIGILDDHGDISVKKRIIFQIFSIFLMIYYGKVQLDNFGDIIGLGYNVTFSGLETIITIICVLGVINALNLIDGIDGLCGSISIIAFSNIIILVINSNHSAPIYIPLYLIFSIAAFLLVNLRIIKYKINKVFLGDSGTTAIGFILSWILIKYTSGEKVIFKPVAALWILTIPIYDTLRLIISRLINSESPFRPGRDHVHHLLLDIGFKHQTVLSIIIILSILFGIIGILGEYYKLKEYYLFFSFVCVFIAYYYLIAKLIKFRNQKIQE